MATESRQCHRPYERKRDSGVQGAGGGGDYVTSLVRKAYPLKRKNEEP